MSHIAVFNAGSSSIKLAVFHAASTPTLLLRGNFEGIGTAPRARLFDAAGKCLVDEKFQNSAIDHAAATHEMMRIGGHSLNGREITAIGHRVVHGGTDFAAPILITDDVIEKLTALIPLAPLHQPHNLSPIRTIREAHPTLPQVACFDTAFHRSQPPLAQAFAIPRKYSKEGVRRYGFHGISYEYVSTTLKTVAPDIADGRVIIAHLGNGASLCAIKGGHSIANTMGFTAVDGLMMGTRCGALDPGVLIHLMDQYGLNARELEDLIYRQSGLLGVSEISSDMRTLRASSEPTAREAIDLFVYRILREIGSLVAALGGIDAIVFTGGIGENDAATRAEIGNGCAWLGLTLDDTANRRAATKISARTSNVAAFVVPTNEELEIAIHTFAVTRS